MINIGQFNTLRVIKVVPFGVYLDGGERGDILLPNKVVPPETKVDDMVDVFIYFDSDDKIIATTATPKVSFGKCAFLKVVDVNHVGAFLDWGLDKDLLVPRPEQRRPMEKDKSYIIYVKQDYQGRIVASSKLDYFLDSTPAPYKSGEEVNLLVAETTPMGLKVIINDSHWGLIHTNDIFQSLGYGKRIKGYVRMVREDGKVDVVLRKIGQDSIQDLSGKIVSALQKAGGFLPLHDKTPPEEIQRAFNESKKSFKSAVGQLYKQGVIMLEPDGIRLK